MVNSVIINQKWNKKFKYSGTLSCIILILIWIFLQVGKLSEIVEAGENLDAFRKLGLLLDTENNNNYTNIDDLRKRQDRKKNVFFLTKFVPVITLK